jgi:tetratricopeptide (TPR) repeat protein
MSDETKMEDIVAQVIETLSKSRAEGRRGLVVIRCGNTQEVDHCRESIRSTESSFGWKSQPVSEIIPPDLIGYLVHKGGRNGPCSLAYGLPRSPEGGLDHDFIRYFEAASARFVDEPVLITLILTMEELKLLSKTAPNGWKSRDLFTAWPIRESDSTFVPAIVHGGIAEHGGGISEMSGGLQASFGVAGVFGNLNIDFSGLAAEDNSVRPWAGAPYTIEDEMPQYITAAAAPVGRRWGRTLAPDDPEGAQLIDQCRILLDKHQTELARQGLAKAAKHFRARNNMAASGECYVLLARASEMRFDHSVALEWYDQALALFEQTDDGAGLSDCCGMIGYLRFLHGDIDGAFTFFDRALRRDEDEEDELRMASGYRRLGVVLEHREEFEKAQTLYERSGAIERNNNDNYAYSRSLHHQARVLQRLEEYEEALVVLQESLTLKEETGDQPGLATGYHEHGNVLLMTGKHEDAVKRYEQALDIEIQMRDMQGIAVTKSQLGLAHKELFQFDEAYGAFFTARDLFHRLQSPNEAVIDSAISSVAEMIDYATMDHQKSKAQAFVNQLMVAPTITMTETQAETA